MKRIVFIIACMALVSAVAFPQEGKKRKEKVTFRVEGMDCNNCVRKIEKNIAFEKGVTDLRCDLSTRTAEVTYRTDKTTADRLVTAFRKIGMGATPVDGKNGANKPPAD